MPRDLSNLPPGVTERMIPGNEPEENPENEMVRLMIEFDHDHPDHRPWEQIVKDVRYFGGEEPDEITANCPHCGLEADGHREESREDTYGGEHEYLACPPEDIRDNEKALAHWLKTGCADLIVIEVDDDKPPHRVLAAYCDGCGADQ